MAHRILREPLFHFLLLAGLLFLLQAMVAGDDREEIRVDAATQEFLFRQQEELTLRTLSEAEKQEIVANYIEEEILVREANKRGLAESSRVRTLLLQNMRFFIAGDVPEPTEEDLRVFFEAEKASFQSPPSLDLDHLLYEDPATVPVGVREELNAGADPAAYGDLDLSYGRRLRFVDTPRLVSGFGSETAKAILDLPEEDTEWHGPFVSPQGSAHFLRVAHRNPPQSPEFETARDWIATQWLAAKARERLDAELDEMRPGYRIEVEPLVPADVE